MRFFIIFAATIIATAINPAWQIQDESATSFIIICVIALFMDVIKFINRINKND